MNKPFAKLLNELYDKLRISSLVIDEQHFDDEQHLLDVIQDHLDQTVSYNENRAKKTTYEDKNEKQVPKSFQNCHLDHHLVYEVDDKANLQDGLNHVVKENMQVEEEMNQQAQELLLLLLKREELI